MKNGVVMRAAHMVETEETKDETESDLTPISDEEPAAGPAKRKREVSTGRISISVPGSCAETIALRGCNSRIESKQKAEGIV